VTATPPKRPRKKPTTANAAAHYTLGRLDQVRLLAHPLRLRLFEAFAVAPRTTHQVAKELGVQPTRLYHHVNALARVGLLRLRETRQVRGATEKYYESAGRMLSVEPALFAPRRKAGKGAGAGGAGAPSREVLDGLLMQLIEGARADLGAALARYDVAPEAERPLAARFVVYGGPAKLAALRRRVMRWIREYSASKPKGAQAPRGAGRATLTLVFTSEPRRPPEERDAD